MKQSYIWVLVGLAALAVAAGAYLYLKSAGPATPAEPSAISIPTGAVKVAPVVKPPELNPIEKTNPFKNTYKNPFE